MGCGPAVQDISLEQSCESWVLKEHSYLLVCNDSDISALSILFDHCELVG